MNDIEIKYQNGRYSLLLDGEEIADKIKSVEIGHMSGLHPPRVSLGLTPGYMIVAGESHIGIDSETYEVLLRLGWTPPKEQSA